MRISDWSSYVCSSDLLPFFLPACHRRNGLLPGLRAAILESGGDGRRLPALHGKAARWFVHRNEPAKAIDHAIAARDLDLVMALMSRNLLEIVTTGELERVLGWLASVPRERMIESAERAEEHTSEIQSLRRTS